jgi:hypothetical protein
MSASLAASTTPGDGPSPASHFATVTVLPTALSTTSVRPASAQDVTLTLHLPHDVATTVTGLDADAVTLLVLELVNTAMRARSC